MKLASVKLENQEQEGILANQGVVLIDSINRIEKQNWAIHLFEMIQQNQIIELTYWYEHGGKEKLESMPCIPFHQVVYAPPYRHPRKIWGIGMNYVKTEEELKNHTADQEPVSFMKPDTALIGPGDFIRLPWQSEMVTAEAELAIIIGKTCRNIAEEEAEQYIAGYTTAFDMAATDIHNKNPRFLTRAKSFDTFFSFGPSVVTPDEIPNILDVTVQNALNGEIHHKNRIYNMRYRPAYIVAFHSQVMTLLPGDVILTGTPGPVVIHNGDVVSCVIEGFETLTNPVKG